MKMVKFKNEIKNGFTIIEVVLVLAVAGLIFLMVFLALPTLQRNQRDTARKNDARNLLAAVMQFKSNNRGMVPVNTNNDAWSKLESYWDRSEYLNNREATHIDAFNTYLWTESSVSTVGYSMTGSWARRPGDWNIALGVTCAKQDGIDGYVLHYGGDMLKNNIAVLVELEGVTTGSGWGYCIDLNQLN